MHGAQHALIGLRASDGENIGEALADLFRLGAHTPRDDHLAVFLQRSPDRLERFRLGAVEKATGVHDDRICACMRAAQLIPLGAQARDDALAIHERLRTAEGDEGNAGLVGFFNLIAHARSLP